MKGFWSLTMYDDDNFLAANPLNRYTLSQRDKFATNPDGSVDLYLQADSNSVGQSQPRSVILLIAAKFWSGRSSLDPDRI